jgi:hypothetical protein
VSAPHVPVTYNRVEQTLSTQLYSARLTRQEERKDFKDMQGFLACGLLHLQEALLNVHLYIQFLLAVIISSLTNILCKHLCYFSARVEQSELFYYLPCSNS